MIKAVIFDADGVLFDTEGAVREATQKVFWTLYRTKVKEEDCRFITGQGTDVYLVTIGNKYGVTVDLGKARALRFAYFKRLLTGRLRVFPGAGFLVKDVKKAGLKVGVATSGERKKLEFTFKEAKFKFSDFDAVLTKDDVEYTKPHPEVYLRILKELALKPKECVVIEDSIAGVTAAKKAGVWCVAVTNSFPREKLTKADLVVGSLAKLPLATILKLGKR